MRGAGRAGARKPRRREGEGAHLDNFCTAGESTYVLGEWVRERQRLNLEDAVRRFTFQPASIMGLHHRGLVRRGIVADLMVFDLAKLGVKEDEITRAGPNGSPRRVQGAAGVDHVDPEFGVPPDVSE